MKADAKFVVVRIKLVLFNGLQSRLDVILVPVADISIGPSLLLLIPRILDHLN